ncbi:hypothetical protein FACUT_7289 [Fusarium acutatum]|uniref:Uncharacterized protein n=1 Tax=Fusarium acutatum TaxID=78861 RepID=A0A8H4JN19_9HYPO|nr:hypothetical protein FACUT_7289 [Fusarium acutatum]
MAQKLLEKHALSREATNKCEETFIAESKASKSKNEALVMELEALKIDSKCCAAQAKELRETYERSVSATMVCNERLGRLTAMVKDLDGSKDSLAAHNNDLLIRTAALGDANKRLEESLDKIVAVAKCSLGVQ